ncbi:N-acetylmuramoyl-L-alanine amidase [Streptomyces sp. SID4919]|uniref:peptidoglycan-binding protein n=1 Tax=unclassified Streptomyces TaxID=2593676 RepID=UPI000823A09F|nr:MULTISPECIES: peptidoglycan-binding protein [unclassified Streptomyces]MYY08834.1 N-acetylmuramoyl-L-alanine amidase [Streptomyces sp. SID4919]SCK25659.1 Uncharacterized protein conserved in bacteria [Streptomyces sp. AmelKG-E11A]
MQLVRRAAYGLPPTSPAARITRTRGVKIHYLGTPYDSRPHNQCSAYVRSIRAAHLAHPTEDYVDIAYNAAVCEHGYVYEGRGPGRRTGANGSAALNSAHYAVLALLGKAGLTVPPPAMLGGLRDAIEWLRDEGKAGDEIRGHRDGHATLCPGPELYAWVKKGAPRPKPPTTPKPKPPPFPGRARFGPGQSNPHITRLGERLVARGYGRHYAEGPGPRWTDADRRAVAAFQRAQGWTGPEADGYPGPETWRRLFAA